MISDILQGKTRVLPCKTISEEGNLYSEMKDRNIFIFTAGDKNARKHLSDSVLKSIDDKLIQLHIDSKTIKEIQDDGYYAWGAIWGQNNYKNWKKMKKGDFIICVYDNKYQFFSKVLKTVYDNPLAQSVWGVNKDGKTWEYMYFMEKPKKIDIPLSDISNDYLYKKYLGFTSISDAKIKNILSKYDNLDIFFKDIFFGEKKKDSHHPIVEKIKEEEYQNLNKNNNLLYNKKDLKDIKKIISLRSMPDNTNLVSFEADDSTLGDSFFGRECEFVIPRYQRPYSWGKDQIDEFWNDLNDDDSNFFIGSVIFNTQNFRENNLIEVIDGQQRLLTATIFSRALLDLFKEIDSEHAAVMESQDFYWQNPTTFTPTYKLFPGDSTFKFFRDYIQIGEREHSDNTTTTINDSQATIRAKSGVEKLSVEEKRIWNNYKIFKGLITEYLSVYDQPSDKIEAVGKLRTRLRKLGIVEIQVQSDEAAYEIFETTNARGLDLSVTDLLKNYIFRNIPEEGGTDEAMEKWKVIVDNIDKSKEKMSKFIRYFWLSKYNFVETKKLFREIKSGTDDWRRLLNDLEESSEIYKIISIDNESYLEEYLTSSSNNNVSRHSSKIIASIRHIRKMNISQHKVFLMSVLRNINNIDYDPTDVLRILESFCYMFYKICVQRGVKVEKLFSKYAVQLEEKSRPDIPINTRRRNSNRIFANFINELKDLKPEEGLFKESFKSLKYNDGGDNFLISYTLQMIDYFLMGSDEELIHNIRELSIEHILPQNPEVWDLLREDVEEYVHSVGNLTLLSQRINGRARNNQLIQQNDDGDEVGKLSVYQDSNLEITRKLVQRINENDNNWTQDTIDERTEYFANIAFDDIWNF